jgi:hypothetical protein
MTEYWDQYCSQVPGIDHNISFARKLYCDVCKKRNPNPPGGSLTEPLSLLDTPPLKRSGVESQFTNRTAITNEKKNISTLSRTIPSQGIKSAITHYRVDLQPFLRFVEFDDDGEPLFSRIKDSTSKIITSLLSRTRKANFFI